MTENKEEPAIAAAARQVMRISPSRRRVLEMTDDLLLKNYALIAHRASSLSSAQRNMVEARIVYGVKEGRIKMEDVTAQVNELTKLVEESITNAELNDNDDSATEQGSPS